MQGWQVLTVLNRVAGAAQDLLYRVIREGLQPQFLDLLELLRLRVGGVILVVVIQPEQGKYLVDRLYMCIGCSPATRFSLPRRCR